MYFQLLYWKTGKKPIPQASAASNKAMWGGDLTDFYLSHEVNRSMEFLQRLYARIFLLSPISSNMRV